MQIILYGNGAIRELSGRVLSCALVVREPGGYSRYEPSGEYRGDARPALIVDGKCALALAPIEDAADLPDGEIDPVWVFERAARERGLYRVDMGGSTFWELSGSWNEAACD